MTYTPEMRKNIQVISILNILGMIFSNVIFLPKKISDSKLFNSTRKIRLGFRINKFVNFFKIRLF
jgi:hypothetical protein